MKACKKINALIGAYIYGDLTLEEMKRVRLHAAECKKCAGEIAAQSRAVSLIPNEPPKLTDEERMQIAWTVKGAVKAKQQAGFRLSFVRVMTGTLVTAVLIGAAFVGGITYQKHYGPAKIKLVKQVIVKEVPAKPSENRPEQPLVTSVPYSMMDPFQRSQQPIYRWMPGGRTAQPESDTESSPAITWPWEQESGSTAPPLILTPTPSDTNTKPEQPTPSTNGNSGQTQ